MSKIFRWCQTSLLVLLLLLPTVLVQAAPDFMPVSEVKTGMQGIAKTVVAGTKIEEFGVEVLGVMKNKGPAGDLILVRTYGDVIDRTGGIAQGMSGSPVYIDGRLVGAIAYGWSLTDHRIGMVTPIADMLKIWELNPAEVAAVEENLASEGMQPVATPVMAAGFGDAAMAMLKDKLAPMNMVPYAVGGAGADVEYGTIEPGSTVGVDLVRGDVSLGALGTVTYTEGDKVLAFGHPFMKKGASGYFMSNAYVFTTVKSLDNSFKVGATGELVGTINQDRSAGIGGVLAKYPSIIPVRIQVHDNSINRSQDAAVQVVNDEQLAPVLAATTVFNVIDKTMDRIGPGSARISFVISGRDLPGGEIKRENMFYSPANIGELAIGEFLEAMAIIAGNQFNPVDIMDIKVNVGIDQERRTAAIMEASADTATAKPGDTINITVKLKPYRGEPITRVVAYTIPKDQANGPLTMEVRGGGMVPLAQLLLNKQGLGEELFKLERNKQQSFSDVLKEFTTRDRNNDIVVEIMAGDFGGMGTEAGKPVVPKIDPGSQPKPNTDKLKNTANPISLLADPNAKTDADKGKTFVTTDYIIEGDTQVLINVQGQV